MKIKVSRMQPCCVSFFASSCSILLCIVYLLLNPSIKTKTVITIGQDFEVTIEDHKTVARRKAQQSLQDCKDNKPLENETPEEQIDRLSACMEQKLLAALESTDEEIEFQSSVRKRIGQSWAHYACQDNNVTTTIPIQNETWTFQPSTSTAGRRVRSSRHEANVMFESDYSRIERIQKLVTDEECAALEQAAQPADGMYALPRAARSNDKLIDAFLTKLEALVSDLTQMKASMSNKDPLMEMRIVATVGEKDSPSSSSSSSQKECAVEADGATCAEVPAPSTDIPGWDVQVESPKVVASILVVCQAPAQGGQIYFPKTGTVLIPADLVGSVVVVLHEVGGMREKDPFVDNYLVCPIQQGKMVTLSDDLAQ